MHAATVLAALLLGVGRACCDPLAVAAQRQNVSSAPVMVVDSSGQITAHSIRRDRRFGGDVTLDTLGVLVQVSGQGDNCQRYGHTADFLGNQVIIYGGEIRGESTILVTTDQIITFDPESMLWRQPLLPSGPEPLPRYYHATAVVSLNGVDHLFMFGGFTQNATALADTWLLSGALQWTEVRGGLRPPARAGHSLHATTGGVVLIGGADTSNILLGDVWFFRISTLTWQNVLVNSPPKPRAFHVAFLHQDQCMYVLGGCLMVDNVYENDELVNTCLERSAEFLEFTLEESAAAVLTGTFIKPGVAGLDKLIPLIWASAVYFSSINTTVVMGGQSDDGLVLPIVWLEFSQNVWTSHELQPSTLEWPDARRSAVLMPLQDTPHIQSLILFGGRDDIDFADDTWMFNRTTESWIQLEEAMLHPPARAEFVAERLGRYVYVAQGWGYDHGRLAQWADSWAWNGHDEVWHQVAPAPGSESFGLLSLRGSASVAYGNRIYIFGGASSPELYVRDTVNQLLAFEPVTPAGQIIYVKLTTIHGNVFNDATVPAPRHLCSMVVWGTRKQLIVFGGAGNYSDLHRPVLNDVWAFDLELQSWIRRVTFGDPLVVPPRFAHVAAVSGDNMYVFGGRTSLAEASGSLLRLDLVSGLWTDVAIYSVDRPSARVAPAALQLSDDILVIFGGLIQAPALYSNELFICHLDEKLTRCVLAPAADAPSFGYARLIEGPTGPGSLFALMGVMSRPGRATLPSSDLRSIRLGCPPGFYAPNISVTGCLFCETGQYMDVNTARLPYHNRACQVCPVGTSTSTTPDPKTDINDCSACILNCGGIFNTCKLEPGAPAMCACSIFWQGSLCREPAPIFFLVVFGGVSVMSVLLFGIAVGVRRSRVNMTYLLAMDVLHEQREAIGRCSNKKQKRRLFKAMLTPYCRLLKEIYIFSFRAEQQPTQKYFWSSISLNLQQVLSGHENSLLRGTRQLSTFTQTFVEDLLTQDLALEALAIQQYSNFLHLDFFRRIRQLRQRHSVSCWSPLMPWRQWRAKPYAYSQLATDDDLAEDIPFLSRTQLWRSAEAQQATFIVYSFAKRQVNDTIYDYLMIWIVTSREIHSVNVALDRRHLNSLILWCTDCTGKEEEANDFRRAYLARLGQPRSSTHLKFLRDDVEWAHNVIDALDCPQQEKDVLRAEAYRQLSPERQLFSILIDPILSLNVLDFVGDDHAFVFVPEAELYQVPFPALVGALFPDRLSRRRTISSSYKRDDWEMLTLAERSLHGSYIPDAMSQLSEEDNKEETDDPLVLGLPSDVRQLYAPNTDDVHSSSSRSSSRSSITTSGSDESALDSASFSSGDFSQTPEKFEYHHVLKRPGSLGKRVRVSIIPSLHLLQEPSSYAMVQTKGGRPKLLWIEVVPSSSGLRPSARHDGFFFSSMEPALRQQLFNRFSVVALLAEQATLTRVTQELEDADAILFVGHTGSAECEHGLKSHLVLANEEHMSLKILNLRPNHVRAVLLFGCSASAGHASKQVPREGPSGLYRDLMRAGIDHAILSLWKITVADVHAFLEEFLPRLCVCGSMATAYNDTLRRNNEGDFIVNFRSFIAAGLPRTVEF